MHLKDSLIKINIILKFHPHKPGVEFCQNTQDFGLISNAPAKEGMPRLVFLLFIKTEMGECYVQYKYYCRV